MSDQAIQLMQGDCLLLLPMLPDNSVDLILTDPPYMGVKSEDWDNQWSSPAAFLDWLGEVLKQFHRVLRPNGSLYLFASPQMSARVECKVGETFNVINRITWRKPPFSTKAEMTSKEDLRSFFPASESIIFAEHFGADNMAKGEAGYVTQCSEAHKEVYGAAFGVYLASEFARAGVTRKELSALFPSCTGRLTGCVSNWVLGANCPSKEQYEAIRDYLNRGGDGDYLRREYDYLRREYDYLSREYEDLRQEYEGLRRPFAVSADVPYTDVWDFETVGTYPGKHPCEKPLPLLRHIITTSSRPGAVVLDAFAGSASTGVACLETGRQFIGMEQDADYYRQGQIRLTGQTLSLFTV